MYYSKDLRNLQHSTVCGIFVNFIRTIFKFRRSSLSCCQCPRSVGGPVCPSVLLAVFLRQSGVWLLLHCRAASSELEPSCAAVLSAALWRMCFCVCKRKTSVCLCTCTCLYLLVFEPMWVCVCVCAWQAVSCAIVFSLRLCLIAMHQRPCQWCLLMGFRFNFYIIM